MPVSDPRDRLVAEIDRLVDEEFARGPCDDDVGQADCALCGGDWHGAPAHADTAREHGRIPDCPGAFASGAQREQWLASDAVKLDLEDLEDLEDLDDFDDAEELCERCGRHCSGCDCDNPTDPSSPSRAPRDSTPPRRPVCSIPLDFP